MAGPVLWLTFDDGTASDRSGNGNNGTLVGAPTFVAGTIANAINLVSASSQDITASSLAALNGTNRFTITAWMKRTASASTVYISQFMGTGATPSAVIDLELYNDGRFYCTLGGSSLPDAYCAAAGTGWFHVAVVYDGTQSTNAAQLLIYINGVAQTLTFEGTIPATLPANTGNFYVGRTYGTSTNYSDGAIDDVRVYTTPLSAVIIRDIYNFPYLAGAGALTAVLNDAEAISAALPGVGALTASLTGTWYASAALAGAGALAATANEGETVAGALAGVGQITSALNEAAAASAALAGAGALAATANSAETIAASLTGTSAIYAYAGASAEANFVGTGLMVATGIEVEQANETFVGGGLLAASVMVDLAATATMAGAGALAAAANAPWHIAGSFVGAGALQAAKPMLAETATAALSGSGALSGHLNSARVISSVIAGSGAVVASAGRGVTISATLAGASALTAKMVPALAIGAYYIGAGSMAAPNLADHWALSETFAGAGLLTAQSPTLLRGAISASPMAGIGALVAGTTGTWYISATLAGLGQQIGQIGHTLTASSTWTGLGVVSANPSRASILAAPWRGAGSVVAIGNSAATLTIASMGGVGVLASNSYRVPPTAPLVPYQGDRHVRRSGDDYATNFAELLPPGAAWPRDPSTTMMRFINSLAQIFGFFDAQASLLLETESDPRQTVNLLPDWERNWGLPDLCVAEPLTIGDRQIALVTKMTLLGGQSRAFFINAAAQIGYPITITEYSPYTCGISQCGDTRSGYASAYRWQCGQPTIRYYWTVGIGNTRLTWFRCGGGGGQCGVDPSLRFSLATDLECLIKRWSPAHTTVIFSFGNLGAFGPMAGTP